MKKHLLILLFAALTSFYTFSQSTQLDSTFNNDGVFLYNIPNTVHDGKSDKIAIQQNGKIVSAGNYFSDNFVFVGRANTDGTPDTSFGFRGFAKVEKIGELAPKVWEQVEDLLIQSNNKILVLGYAYRPGSSTYRLILFRLNNDGSRDTSFGENGYIKSNVFDSLNFVPREMALQQDGKIIIVGYENITYNSLLTRLNSDGTLDQSFGNKGLVVQPPFSGLQNLILRDVAVNSQGKIICSGFGITNSSNSKFLAITYLQNGQIDTRFGNDGLFLTDFFPGYSDESATYLKIIQGDKILLGGDAVTYRDKRSIALAQLNANGTLDNTFGNGGKSMRPLPDYNYSLSDMAVSNTGKIVFSGTQAFNATFWKFNANGSVDITYGINGQFSFTRGILSDAFFLSIAFQTDDKLVAGGYIPRIIYNDCLAIRFKNDASGEKAGVSTINIKQKNNIVVLPNPAQNFINISGLNVMGKANVTINDNSGSAMRSVIVENAAQIEIKISDLQPGIYYIRITEAGKVTQKKIIKQ